MTSRRAILAGALAATLPLAARAQDADPAELLKPGPLDDIWRGEASARVTVIEYASLTCGHCGRFHRGAWKEIKSRYVDRGLVRFTLRPFPLDPLSTVAFMMARSEPSRYYAVVDLLFETQDRWAYVDEPLQALRQTLLTADFTQESLERLLRDQRLLDGVNGVKERGEVAFKVAATPTFFINGQRRQGAISIDEFEAIIRPILGP